MTIPTMIIIDHQQGRVTADGHDIAEGFTIAADPEIDMLDGAKKPRPGDGPRVQQKIRDLAAKGASDREIGAHLGITVDSAYNLRRRLGIPSGKSVREAAAESGGTP